MAMTEVRGSSQSPMRARAKGRALNAEAIAEGSWTTVRARVAKLKVDLEFADARRLLERAKADPALAASAEDLTWALQQLALCTYKDDELPLNRRLGDAERILEGIGLRDSGTTDGETLALGGAVFKRRWESGGQLEHLQESLAFYRAAWERADRETSKLYAGVNACYLLDVLASRARAIARRTGTRQTAATAYTLEADTLRRNALSLADSMSKRDPALAADYWHLVSTAELHLGLGRRDPAEYERAAEASRLAAAMEGASEWQRQTTFQQMTALLRCNEVDPPSAHDDIDSLPAPWRAVAVLLGAAALPALSSYRGKVGLALSGGGFRASLYHLGVLARLAEVDALRSVEVLSTVSGGSIVGAHYYLELQRLLESTVDAQIGAAHYIAIVRRIQDCLLAGVQQNLRMRALGSLRANLKVAFDRTYTLSRRLGELYESILYSQVEDGRGSEERRMPSLLIRPLTTEPALLDFKPKFSNWRRGAKVPILLLNATSLNSGHNWQFTARWMGEPPGRLNTNVDANLRYRRLWYEHAPLDDFQRFRLGYAVAASACVPGLFEPIVLDQLYPDTTVRLVDGGVHDNQGVAGLLDEGCTLILASDACGQMADQTNPPDGRLGVPLRSNSILMDRVREAEYEDLENRVGSRALQGLLFVHLKQDLEVRPVDWVACQDPTPPAEEPTTATRYGIDRDLQRQLAAVRTDLDSFTEVEAYALMLSGYLATDRNLRDLDAEHGRSGLPGTWGNFKVHAPRGDWPFLKLAEIMGEPEASSDPRRKELGRQLTASSAVLLKAWKLDRGLRIAGYVLVTVLGLALIAGAICFRKHSWPISVGGIAVTVVLTALAVLVPATRWLRPQQAARSVLLKIGVAFAGYVVARFHLAFIDPRFRKAGRLDKLLS
jgi:predicted acylesterase/phospholipase RssA